MNDVTLCLPYYLNPGMLAVQYRAIADLATDLKAHIRLIVVDDGSPTDPATAPDYDLGVDVAIFRIMVDVAWNQDAARNLGVAQARTDWVILTDIDHVVTPGAWRQVIGGNLNPYGVYRFAGRLDAPDLRPKLKDGKPHPHPNSWAMTRATYGEIGGYDEALAGNYGTDGDFARRARRVSEIVALPAALVRYPREVVPDASTTTLERKRPEDKAAIKAIMDRRGDGWRPLNGSFPWVRVA